MKITDLEIGKIYKCKLSQQEILVVKTTRTTKEAKGKQAAETEELTAGKSCVIIDGKPHYLHTELHDGQLETILEVIK